MIRSCFFFFFWGEEKTQDQECCENHSRSNTEVKTNGLRAKVYVLWSDRASAQLEVWFVVSGHSQQCQSVHRLQELKELFFGNDVYSFYLGLCFVFLLLF